LDEVVKALRHESDGNFPVSHRWAHLVEELRLAHVVTVHHHENVALGDVLGLGDAGIDFVQYCVVEVGRLAVELAWQALSIADVVDVVVACTLFC
jgi:hypothetical protein